MGNSVNQKTKQNKPSIKYILKNPTGMWKAGICRACFESFPVYLAKEKIRRMKFLSVHKIGK